MSRKHMAFALLTVMAALAAQPLPELHTEAVAAGSVFHVKNTSAQPLTAYLIELVGYPGSSYWLCQDDVAAPIAPGAEKGIRVTNMTVGAAPEYVKITAALYADGSSAGAPDKVAQIVGRRKSTLETTREVTRRVEKAQQSATAKDAIIADLNQWANSLTPQGKSRRVSQESINQAAARQAVSDAAGYLGEHSIEETLTDLRAMERSLAASKP
jgi:hypothetical protein